MAARIQVYAVTRRGPSGPAPAGVTWRLLSRNNRDIGRAAAVYPEVEECLSAVSHLRQALAGGSALPVTSRDIRARWTWRVQADAVDLAVSSRSYQRRVQTGYAVALFLRLVTDADVVRAAEPLTRPGPLT